MTDKWQPIETAPKDGTTVQLWGKYCSEPATARWIGSEYRGSWKAVWDGFGVIEHQGDFGTDYREFEAPTRWQPLPKPPAMPQTDKPDAFGKPVHPEIMRGDIIAAIQAMTPDQRMDVLHGFCRHCGSDNPQCQCWNDE